MVARGEFRLNSDWALRIKIEGGRNASAANGSGERSRNVAQPNSGPHDCRSRERSRFRSKFDSNWASSRGVIVSSFRDHVQHESRDAFRRDGDCPRRARNRSRVQRGKPLEIERVRGLRSWRDGTADRFDVRGGNTAERPRTTIARALLGRAERLGEGKQRSGNRKRGSVENRSDEATWDFRLAGEVRFANAA